MTKYQAGRGMQDGPTLPPPFARWVGVAQLIILLACGGVMASERPAGVQDGPDPVPGRTVTCKSDGTISVVGVGESAHVDDEIVALCKERMHEWSIRDDADPVGVTEDSDPFGRGDDYDTAVIVDDIGPYGSMNGRRNPLAAASAHEHEVHDDIGPFDDLQGISDDPDPILHGACDSLGGCLSNCNVQCLAYGGTRTWALVDDIASTHNGQACECGCRQRAAGGNVTVRTLCLKKKVDPADDELDN